MEWHRVEFGARVPTRKGWTSPSRIDPGQKDKVLFSATESRLPAEVHVTLASPVERVGVSQGRVRVPHWSSYYVLRRSAKSHGACPGGGMPSCKKMIFPTGQPKARVPISHWHTLV